MSKTYSVSVRIEVYGESQVHLLHQLACEIAERDIPPKECVGLFGWNEIAPLHIAGIHWEHSPQLMPGMAVVWHPAAIIPPATVLNPSAVIYGHLRPSGTAE